MPFDPAQFADLRERLRRGEFGPRTARLERRPEVISENDGAVRAVRADDGEARMRGEGALRDGRVAVLVLNGGMAMRFGGVAKGTVPVHADHGDSFLALKLADVARVARRLKARIPTVVMHSFATRSPSQAHLGAIDWSGVYLEDRDEFVQSIMPRVTPEGDPLTDHELAEQLTDTQVYSAPGHGDTLHRLRASGVLSRLRERGVEHLLVSNVDNLGATIDPVVLGHHLHNVERGDAMTVEVVRRADGDRGGCIARVEDRPVIVEGFRLPEGVDVADYPHFNTNTLWFRLAGLDKPQNLSWFPVYRSLQAGGRELPIVQFEQLIGQATEHLPSSYLEVDRAERFMPIKTRDDLKDAAHHMLDLIRRLGR